jgi:hypothetical protein
MNANQRFWVFWFVCIPVRLAIAVFTQLMPTCHGACKWIVPVPYLIIGLGFFKNACTGKEIGFFGGRAWWASYRPVHGLLWFGAGILILGAHIFDETYVPAAVLLYLDVAFGIIVRIYHARVSSIPAPPAPPAPPDMRLRFQ